MASPKVSDKLLVFIVGGFALGALMGFLTRPSGFLVGQLPLATVLSRGAGLTDLDALLIPLAQRSFNQMFAFAIVGGIVGFVIGRGSMRQQ